MAFSFMTMCHYCGHREGTTRDHIVPKSLGGKNGNYNVVPACANCNSRKDNQWPTCECNKCQTSIEIHAAGGIIRPAGTSLFYPEFVEDRNNRTINPRRITLPVVTQPKVEIKNMNTPIPDTQLFSSAFKDEAAHTLVVALNDLVRLRNGAQWNIEKFEKSIEKEKEAKVEIEGRITKLLVALEKLEPTILAHEVESARIRND